jgi:flagellar basal-body rod protein FlgG
MKALAIAATGMNAQQTNIETIANNIANINTTAYKRARPEFTDLIYQAERIAGAPNAGGSNLIPEGAYMGLGVRTAAIRNLHTQGSLTSTGNTLDLAINGRGWFQVVDAQGNQFYTRAGALNKNDTGQIVTADGYVLQPAMTIPIDATQVTINQAGRVFVRIGTDTNLQEVGQLVLANFINDAGLRPVGGNLFRESDASGVAQLGAPADPAYGILYQGYLENSNVDSVKEITELISAQRAFEMNSKVIQATDSIMGTIANGLRG